MFGSDGRYGLGAVMLCLFLASMTCRHVQAEISLEEGPHDVTAIQGETVTLVCDFSNADGYVIYWRYGDTQRYLTINRDIETNLPIGLRNRLSVIGNVSKEEFTLRIENVQEADSGEYYCAYISLIAIHRQLQLMSARLYLPFWSHPVHSLHGVG